MEVILREGFVYVKIFSDTFGHNDYFFFTHADVPPLVEKVTMTTLAKIENGLGRSSTCFWPSVSSRQPFFVKPGEVRRATDNDLRALLKMWKCCLPISTWVENINNMSQGILHDEKLRIARIASEFN